MLIIAMFIGHAYMGTIGVTGSWQAMKTGYVDEGWAEEHHKLWRRRHRRRQGPGPAQRAAAGPRRSGGLTALSSRESDASFHRAAPTPLALTSRGVAKLPPPIGRGQGEGRRNCLTRRRGPTRSGRTSFASRWTTSPTSTARRAPQRASPRSLPSAAPAASAGSAAAPAPICWRRARPGPHVSTHPGAAKPLEASGAHSPPGTATRPPSNKATSAEMTSTRIATCAAAASRRSPNTAMKPTLA